MKVTVVFNANDRLKLPNFAVGTFFGLVGIIYALAIGFAIYKLHYTGRLPLPFYDDSNDTFMDFFNTFYWAGDRERYTVWHSVYPPFVFAALSFFVDGFARTPEELRIYFLWLYILIVCFYVLFVFCYCRDLTNRNQSVAILGPVSVILFSFPSLFSIERGNLILLCAVFLMLSIRSTGLMKDFFLAVAISIKPYLLFLLFASFLANLRGRILIVVFFISILNFFSGYLISDPHWLNIFFNIAGFDGSNARSIYEIVSSSSSLPQYLNVFSHPKIFAIPFLYSISTYALVIKLFIYSILFMTLISTFIAIFKYKIQLRKYELEILFLNLLLICFGFVGNYASLFLLIYLVPYIYLGRISNRSLFLIFFIFLPFDISTTFCRTTAGVSFLSGVYYTGDGCFGYLGLSRPFLYILLQFSIIYEISTRRNNLLLNAVRAPLRSFSPRSSEESSHSYKD